MQDRPDRKPHRRQHRRRSGAHRWSASVRRAVRRSSKSANSDQLLPYLEHVARRPYNNGLNACWDLKPGERVLLRVDNWHSELVIEACKKILEKYKVKYEIKTIDRGPVQAMGRRGRGRLLPVPHQGAGGMDGHGGRRKRRRPQYDKILMGYGGPVLAERLIKIQRMPFITPEILASPAHAMPIEVLNAIDRWTWDRVRTRKARADHRPGRHRPLVHQSRRVL